MQYHFHLIRNILKLPYCFPLETPSAPKSDNRSQGCQSPLCPGAGARLGDQKGHATPAVIPCGARETAHGSEWGSLAVARAGEGAPSNVQRGAQRGLQGALGWEGRRGRLLI